MSDLPLFDCTYPNTPGYRDRATSKEAAEAMKAAATSLRARVLRHLIHHPSTVHETAAALNESVPSIQPRFSELRRTAAIEPTGQRRQNNSGMSAHVWRVPNPTGVTHERD